MNVYDNGGCGTIKQFKVQLAMGSEAPGGTVTWVDAYSGNATKRKFTHLEGKEIEPDTVYLARVSGIAVCKNQSSLQGSLATFFQIHGNWSAASSFRTLPGTKGLIAMRLKSTDNTALRMPVEEGEGAVSVEIIRLNGTLGTISATLSIGSRTTATAGVDFTFVPIDVEFESGEIYKLYTLTVHQDSDFEYPNEMIELALTGETDNGDNVVAEGRSTLIIDILDDGDFGTFLLDSASYRVEENAGSLSVGVQRTGGTSRDAYISISVSDITAVQGEDYDIDASGAEWIELNGANYLILPDGSQSASFSLTILNDDLYEHFDEEFEVRIAGVWIPDIAEGGALVDYSASGLGSLTKAKVGIGNDGDTSHPGKSPKPIVVEKSGGTLTVKISEPENLGNLPIYACCFLECRDLNQLHDPFRSLEC